jgi:hypothetical protein
VGKGSKLAASNFVLVTMTRQVRVCLAVFELLGILCGVSTNKIGVETLLGVTVIERCQKVNIPVNELVC